MICSRIRRIRGEERTECGMDLSPFLQSFMPGDIFTSPSNQSNEVLEGTSYVAQQQQCNLYHFGRNGVTMTIAWSYIFLFCLAFVYLLYSATVVALSEAVKIGFMKLEEMPAYNYEIGRHLSRHVVLRKSGMKK